MSTPIQFLRKLLDVGMALEDALLAAEQFEQELSIGLTARRANDAERQRRRRAKGEHHVMSRDTRDERDSSSLPPSVSPGPPSTTTNLSPVPPYSPPTKSPSAAPKPNGFARFWEAYPEKVGKRAAEAAFAKAVRRIEGDPLAAMLPAIDRAKQSRKWREGIIPNPATWLNQDRWLDGVAPKSQSPPPAVGADVLAERHRHYRETGEWKPSWGPCPEERAA